MNTETTKPIMEVEAIRGTERALPTRTDFNHRREEWLRHFFVGPDEPAARAVWRVSQIYWLVVLYSGIWIVLRSYGIGGAKLPIGAVATLTGLFVLAAAHLYLRSALTIRRGGYGAVNVSKVAWLHTGIDLAIIAATVRVTGGVDSGIWGLFFVIVVAESVLEPLREARYVRIGVAVALIAATVPFPWYVGNWILELLTRLVFLLAVSVVAQRLRQSAEQEKAELASLRAELGLLEERSKLSREIHDGVGNALAASVLRLEVTARVLAKGHNDENMDAPALLREEAGALRDAMNGVRDWTFFNKPWRVGEGETGARIAERLLAETERLSRRTNLPVRVIGADSLDNVRNVITGLAVLRITQEALTNAAKYATGATEAVITIARDGDRLRLSITDDGAGFDTDIASTGVGMSSMRERASGLGGSLEIVSAPAKGTTVVALLPLR